MKLEQKIEDKKRDLERLDENYCVWLTRRAPIWRIGFDYNLYVITGNDPQKIYIRYTEDPLDVWYRELRKNKRARLEFYGRTWLTEAYAIELRDKIVACGGKAELGTFCSEEELEGKRKKIKIELQRLEQKLNEQKAELKRKAAEDRASALAQGAISPEQLALVEEFFSRREVEYVINKKGEVNVYGDIILDSDDLVNDEIPFQFGKVEGDFDCSGLMLETLRNSPHWVGGDFNCAENMLEDLEFCPSHVEGDFICTDNGEYPDFSEDDVHYIGGEFISDPTSGDI